ncbi:hypothetical protein TNCV_617091, partial [Trichonephila clavipes]
MPQRLICMKSICGELSLSDTKSK